MWLKNFLRSNGYRVGKANEQALAAKTISMQEYQFLIDRSCDQLRIQEEILLHSGAFHAVEYLQKAIEELELLTSMVDMYHDTHKGIQNGTDASKSSDFIQTQRAKILKFDEKRPT